MKRALCIVAFLVVLVEACELRDPPPCSPHAVWPDPCAGATRVRVDGGASR